MFATLLAVVVALVPGYLAPDLTASLRDHRWFGAWLGWNDARLGGRELWRGRWGLVLVLAPPLLLVALAQWLLDGVVFGLPGLLFAVAVLFHAWGPGDLDRDVDAVIEAGTGDGRRAAAARLWPTARRDQACVRPSALVDAVVDAALRRWFGVLLWFLVLGPVGALGYRLVAIVAADAVAARLPPAMVEGARVVLAVLDWPAAQLMTLSLALVGDFEAVLAAWKEASGAAPGLDTGFLHAAARASVRSGVTDAAEDGVAAASVPEDDEPGPLPELRDAMGLVRRSLLLWLAVIALFVMAGWVS